jgi:hypothetical protein
MFQGNILLECPLDFRGEFHPPLPSIIFVPAPETLCSD